MSTAQDRLDELRERRSALNELERLQAPEELRRELDAAYEGLVTDPADREALDRYLTAQARMSALQRLRQRASKESQNVGREVIRAQRTVRQARQRRRDAERERQENREAREERQRETERQRKDARVQRFRSKMIEKHKREKGHAPASFSDLDVYIKTELRSGRAELPAGVEAGEVTDVKDPLVPTA